MTRKEMNEPCRAGTPNGKGTTAPCPHFRLCIPETQGGGFEICYSLHLP